MAKTKLKLWHIILAVIAIAVIMSSNGGEFLGSLQTGAGFSFLGAIEDGDAFNSNCKIGKETVATIKCDLDEETSEDYSDGDTFTNYFYEAEVTNWDSGIWATGKIKDLTTNNFVCSYLGAEPDCLGYSGFVYGHTYEVSDLNFFNTLEMTLTGNPLVLYYSDAFGYNEAKIKGTQGCISVNIADKMEQSGIDIHGTDLEDGILEPIQTLNRGNTFTFTVAYEEIAPVGLQWYNGQPVSCEQNNFLLRKYKQVQAEYGSACWLLPDEVIKRDENICCDSSWCRQTLNEDYACENFECVFGGETTRGCSVSSECGDTYCTLSADGTYSYYHPYCDTSRPQPQNNKAGTCAEEEEHGLECCPEERYPNDMCCMKNESTDTWELRKCPHGLLSCTATLGLDACCLDTQSVYTVHECAEGLKCCDSAKDGIGQCKEYCDPLILSPFAGLATAFQNMMKGLGFDFSLDFSKILLILLGIGAVFFFLSTILKEKDGGKGPSGSFGPYQIIPPRMIRHSRPRWRL